MCLSILSCSHFCFINDILVKFKEIGKKGGKITNFTLFGLCQNQRQSSSKAPVYSRVKDMFHHKTSAQILMQSGKKSWCHSPQPTTRHLVCCWTVSQADPPPLSASEQRRWRCPWQWTETDSTPTSWQKSACQLQCPFTFGNQYIHKSRSHHRWQQRAGGLVSWQKKRLVGFMIWFLIYSYDLWNLNTSFILEWRHYPRLSYQCWFVFHLYLII